MERLLLWGNFLQKYMLSSLQLVLYSISSLSGPGLGMMSSLIGGVNCLGLGKIEMVLS